MYGYISFQLDGYAMPEYGALVTICGYDWNAYNNVRDLLYNTDVITNIVKSIVHSPVGKLV